MFLWISRVSCPFLYFSVAIKFLHFSAGLTRWVSRRMDAVASNLTRAAPEEDVNSLVGAIKREVIGEVNRTIFGSEFQGTIL